MFTCSCVRVVVCVLRCACGDFGVTRMSGVVRRHASVLSGCACSPFSMYPGRSAVSDPREARPWLARVAHTLSCCRCVGWAHGTRRGEGSREPYRRWVLIYCLLSILHCKKIRLVTGRVRTTGSYAVTRSSNKASNESNFEFGFCFWLVTTKPG